MHCVRTTVIKGLSWLPCVGSSLEVLCSFRCLVGKKRCFCMEQWSAVPACCAACEPHAAVSGTAWSLDCSSLVRKFCDPCQRSQPGADLVRICLAMASVLQRNLESPGSVRADSGKGPCQPLQITLLLSLSMEASSCVEKDHVHSSPQPSESVSLAVTMPYLACP